MKRNARALLPWLFVGLATASTACESDPPSPFERPREETSEEEVDDDDSDRAPPPAEEPPPPPACKGQTAAYDPVYPRTNVLFVLDRSGSMHTPLPNGKTRWTATRDALFGLVEKLPAKNARVGVLQFPQGDSPLSCCRIQNRETVCHCASYPGPSRRCSASTYQVSNPVQLDAGKIASIKASVNASNASFYWGTPLAAALTAAINAQKSSANDGVKSVVLLTDGEPTSCETSRDPGANDDRRVIEAAKLGMAGAEKVRTYVLGIMDGRSGARADLLSRVAEAGGTARSSGCSGSDSCFYPVEAKSSLTTLAATLDRIAKEQTDCTFRLPAATGATDLAEIDVTLTRSGGPQILTRDKAHREGWDLLAGNKQFKLYGEACRALKEDPKARVQIVVGCKTAPAAP